MLLPSCLHMLTFTGMTISQSTDLSNGPTFFIFLSLGVSICLDSLDYPTMSRNLNRDSRSRHFKNRHLDTSKPKSRQSRLPYNVEKSQSRLSISAFQKPTSQQFEKGHLGMSRPPSPGAYSSILCATLDDFGTISQPWDLFTMYFEL
jgi:hypothetical protein